MIDQAARQLPPAVLYYSVHDNKPTEIVLNEESWINYSFYIDSHCQWSLNA